MPKSTVLSKTCPEEASVALPGGSVGAITATTMGVAIALRTIAAITIRRRWFGSFTLGASSHTTWRNPSM